MDESCCRSTSRFRSELSKLRKKYENIEDDIKAEFHSVPFIDLFNWNYRLQDAGNYRLIKRRISNSHNQTGKSGGFRIYYIANLVEEKVTFLTIYPKSNNMGKDNLKKEILKQILSEFKKENSEKVLADINFEKIL
ncbi:hypothetical protein [Sphingobacterium faecium]|uniref:hypothetical protein n=1 Tax=Sphingobacterium faecium TaxID=34087 RepID=UPI002478D543|nr:hypothetical protein [Sphingobacterium faecium]WGQ15584.1 hypothetical protein QG727_04050 [Sphingobacterium faecium]